MLETLTLIIEALLSPTTSLVAGGLSFAIFAGGLLWAHLETEG